MSMTKQITHRRCVACNGIMKPAEPHQCPPDSVLRSRRKAIQNKRNGLPKTFDEHLQDGFDIMEGKT